MDPWGIVWSQRDVLLAGFLNTLLLFGGSVLGAAILGCGLAVVAQGRGAAGWLVNRFVDVMRMLPFLLYAYLLYYGLPSAGLVLSAWTVGFIGLITYHAAYIAEILRGAWAVLPAGQAEAARACGYRPVALYRQIILPQLLMTSGPVLGNQAIILLKDTAFLSIITVRELTAVAGSIQNTYFIPYQALLTSILFYWGLSMLIEVLASGFHARARRRGLVA